MSLPVRCWTKLRAPVSIRNARWLKVAGTLLLALAALAVLYSGLSSPIPPAYRNAYRIEILIVAGIALIHLFYLGVVFNEYLIGKAVENVTLIDALFPFLLVAVYVFYGLHSLQFNRGLVTESHRLEIAAYSLFIVLYTTWLGRDWLIWRKQWRNGWETAIWVIVDILSVVVLGAYLLGFLEKGNFWVNDTVTPKDWAVAVCVGAWGMLGWFARRVRRGNYRSEYSEYLSFNRIVEIQGQNISNLGKAELREITVVDLGCGDGSRAIQLLNWMKANGHLCTDVRISVIGYDRDDSWRGRFGATCKTAGLTAEFIGNDAEALRSSLAKADVLLLSHVLYELPTCRFVAHLLQNCKLGTLVVARGTAARSFFTVVNLAYSRRFPSPTISHLWRSHGLASLVKAGVLKEVASCNIEQSYSLSDGGKAAAKDLLSFLYGDGAAQLADEYFAMLLGEDSTTVSNDDVFVFLTVVSS